MGSLGSLVSGTGGVQRMGSGDDSASTGGVQMERNDEGTGAVQRMRNDESTGRVQMMRDDEGMSVGWQQQVITQQQQQIAWQQQLLYQTQSRNLPTEFFSLHIFQHDVVLKRCGLVYRVRMG